MPLLRDRSLICLCNPGETVQELKSGYGIKVFELFLLDSSVNYDVKATISFRVAVARPEKNG